VALADIPDFGPVKAADLFVRESAIL
jgi:hypothetical protein